MNVRHAKATDIPVIIAMLHEMFARSKYVGRGEISDKAAERLLEGAIAAQGQSGPQASHVQLAEFREQYVGFILGTLDRVYHIGNKLMAQDVFFYVKEKAPIVASLRLVDGYMAWAQANPKVIEINLSWSDAIPGADKLAALAARKGFVKTGEMFEMRTDLIAGASA